MEISRDAGSIPAASTQQNLCQILPRTDPECHNLGSHFIENAARYLLSVMETREFVDYSTFYDGTGEIEERLRQAVEPDPEEDSQSPELMMDLAVGQLMEQGIVERNDLDSELSDGEKDYRIAWTEGGREKARKERLVFYDVEM